MNRWVPLLAFVITAACGDAERVPVADSAPPDADYNVALIAELDEAIGAGRYPNVNGIVVLEQGELLFERYYDVSADDVHDVRSVGKTFASTLLGMALAAGHIDGLDQTLADFYEPGDYDNYSDAKASVTLGQLLTMTSGFDGDDSDPDSPGNEENMYPTDDWVRWTLNLPMAGNRTPGERWAYFTAGVVVLGDILHQALPGGLAGFADENLFQPLGIENYRWPETPTGVANTAGGIRLTPRGFATFGQLYKNGGRWEGEQVLPEKWVRESLTPRVSVGPNREDRYGYLWWHKFYEVAGARHGVAYASGNGGNKIFVFDDLPLVVVVTASAYGQRYMHPQVDEIMTGYVLPAVLGGRARQ